MQYAAGPHRIASWAHITNAHIFPGPAIIQALHESANSAVAANNSTFRTEITAGHSHPNGYLAASESPEAEHDLDQPSADHRKGSVSVQTTISMLTEYITPPPPSPSSSSINAALNPSPQDFSATAPPLARGLLLLAQMSSKDNLFTDAYTQRCLEMARQDPSFVIGFIAQEALNARPGDNFVVMTPGVNLPPAAAVGPPGPGGRVRSEVKADALGQQYNTPRKVVVEKGVDVVIVGRGLYKADDPASEAERYRREAWEAYLERIGQGNQ